MCEDCGVSRGPSTGPVHYKPAPPGGDPASFDASFTTLVVGVRGVLGGWLGYGLNYTKVSGRSGVKEDYVNGTLSIRF